MSSVQVILLRNIPTLGKLGDVVKVKRGHARNHLLPTKQAQFYTKENWKVFSEQKKELIKQQKAQLEKLKQQCADLDGYLLQCVVQASEEGQLYGSVNSAMIVDLLRKQNHVVKRNQIALPNNEPIKHIGEYEIVITLSEDLVAKMKFSVLSDK